MLALEIEMLNKIISDEYLKLKHAMPLLNRGLIPQRAMLPPPRLPALCIVFYAAACIGRSRAGHGLMGCLVRCILHANPCTLYMHRSLQTRLARKRALEGRKTETKKPLISAAVVVSGECGRLSRSAQASAVL